MNISVGVKWSSFLALMQEKNQKKIRRQGRRPNWPGTWCVLDLLLIFRLLDDLLFLPWCKKRSKKKNQASGTPAKLAWYVMCTRSASYFSSFRWSSFLALMQEKKQKKSGPLPRPGKLAGYMRFSVMYPVNLASGRSRLLLIEEKNQKKIKASTEAGEAGRVLYGM